MSLDLNQLNQAQKQAVTHNLGPAILIAGAGTGKTTVITNRIAYLIDQGLAKPEEILAVTFTEKAATEMAERVDRLLPLGYSDLWIHTFHGFCEKILKNYAIDIGLPNDFKLLDKTAAWLLVRENLDKFDLDYYSPLGNPTRFIHALLDHFSRCKDEVVYPEDYLEYAEKKHLDTDQSGDREEIEQETKRVREVANAYHVYQQLLLEHDALDFGDLINYTLKLFQKRKNILQKFREQFKYILVDEFQDTNWAQYELIKILAAPKNNLMVVGDDDQAIYKFRGAAVSNILSFKKDFEKQGLAEIFLTDNYRSGQNILDTAYSFIQLNNPDRLEFVFKKQKLNKKLISHSPDKGAVEVLSYTDKNAEIDGVLNKIVELKKQDKKLNWSDFAILVRANDSASGFVSMMRKIGMPYQFLASRGLYTQDIVLDIMAWLKLLDNYHESTALFRILSLAHINLDIQTIINLNHLASRKAWSLYFTLNNYKPHIQIPVGSAKIIAELVNSIHKYTELAKSQPVSQIVYSWLESSGYLQVLTLEQNIYNTEQLRYLNQFYKKLRAWEEEHVGSATTHDFLAMMDMEQESGELGALTPDEEIGPDVVKVMTIHGAKGLEFKYVFVVSLVHLRFPSTERKDPIEIPPEFIKETLPSGDAHLQEERRLFYVALTRAKSAVLLTWAKDYGGLRERKPSRFLDEIKIKSQDILSKDIKEPQVDTQRAKTKTKLIMPKAFSFSQLRAYESCPWQYYYTYIVKVPTRGNASFSFGSTMHSTMQKFYKLIQEASVKKQADLFGQNNKVAIPTIKELLNFYEESWIDDWYESPEQKEKYRLLGKQILTEYFEKYQNQWTVPVYLEKGFTIKVGDYSVRGVIDRVDLSPDKSWQIIDYKTGRPKDTLTFDDKKQLLIYQIAASEIFGVKVDSLTFYYLNSNMPVSFVGSQKDIAKTKDWILKTINSILSDDFKPTPGKICQNCDYNSMCPYVKRNNT